MISLLLEDVLAKLQVYREAHVNDAGIKIGVGWEPHGCSLSVLCMVRPCLQTVQRLDEGKSCIGAKSIYNTRCLRWPTLREFTTRQIKSTLGMRVARTNLEIGLTWPLTPGPVHFLKGPIVCQQSKRSKET